MAWRGRGRGRPGGFARHDITLKDDEQLSDVPQTYPPAPMPGKAPQQDDLEAETKRLLVRTRRDSHWAERAGFGQVSAAPT